MEVREWRKKAYLNGQCLSSSQEDTCRVLIGKVEILCRDDTKFEYQNYVAIIRILKQTLHNIIQYRPVLCSSSKSHGIQKSRVTSSRKARNTSPS